jgi:outer membrane receptor protein involved in Fe transport
MRLSGPVALRKLAVSKSMIRGYVLALLFWVGGNSAAWAVTLQGTVTDPSGKAVAGARVALLRSLVETGECQTDVRGAYHFEGLQEGVYQVAASAPGLSSPPLELRLNQEQLAKHDIQLEISAISSQVVVSAALGGALAPHIGSSVSLVSLQEIENRGAQNAFEIIRGIPGIEVNQAGRLGGVTGVYIRGGESKYNAIMIDGIPLNEFGGNFDMASLPADGIERMEVTRGPQSALYGSNALTGVINLVSRRGEGAPSFTALAEGGSHNTRRFATGGNGLTKGLRWSYHLSRLDSDGVVANDNYRDQSAFLSLEYSRGGRQLDFHFFGNANASGAPGPYGSDPNGTFAGLDTISRGKQNLFGYQVGYTERISSRLRQVSTASLATNDLFYHSPWGDSQSENLRGIFNTRSEILLSTKDSLAAGFEFNREQIKNTYIVDSGASPFLLPRTSLAYFVENRWSPSGRLYVITGVRLDNLRTHALPPSPATFGSQHRPLIPESSIIKVNPRISLAYIAQDGKPNGILGSTRIHGSFGTGIRPPDGFELAFTNNPKLKPEKSTSFDAGVEQKLFSSRTIMDLTYFFNRFQDQIVTLGGSLSNLSAYTSANLKNSKAQGLEVSFRTHPISSLELGGSYTFLDSAILALDGTDSTLAPFHPGQQPLRRPRHAGSYNVSWKHGNLILNTNAYIRGSVLDVEPSYGLSACSFQMQCLFDNPGYTRMDAGFSYRLPRGVEIYGRVNNLLNRKYEETFGYPALQAIFTGGVKLAFPSE